MAKILRIRAQIIDIDSNGKESVMSSNSVSHNFTTRFEVAVKCRVNESNSEINITNR